jgi:excisionase family DNA binding protein
MVDEPFVPIEEVSKYFSVSISTVRAWIRMDLVPALKIGGVYRFRISEVEHALRAACGGGLPKEAPDGSLTIPLDPNDPQAKLNFNPDEDI